MTEDEKQWREAVEDHEPMVLVVTEEIAAEFRKRTCDICKGDGYYLAGDRNVFCRSCEIGEFLLENADDIITLPLRTGDVGSSQGGSEP